jgi:hypothetical protein
MTNQKGLQTGKNRKTEQNRTFADVLVFHKLRRELRFETEKKKFGQKN